MSDFYTDITKFPNEILVEIFNNLDIESLDEVSRVCRKWNAIVQWIHDKAWKSITKAIALERSILGPKYEDRGWHEEEHSMSDCLCFEIAKDVVFYDDVELLQRDIELIEMNTREKLHEFMDIEEPNLEEVQAASRLSAAGIIWTLG